MKAPLPILAMDQAPPVLSLKIKGGKNGGKNVSLFRLKINGGKNGGKHAPPLSLEYNGSNHAPHLSLEQLRIANELSESEEKHKRKRINQHVRVHEPNGRAH